MNLIFGGSKTFEARVHTPTLNKYKVIAWIYYLNALLEFAEKNQERILNKDKIDVQDIISIYKEKGKYGNIIHEFLFNYIVERIDTFEKYYTIHHIYYPHLEELKNDCTFVPKVVPDELRNIFEYSERMAGGEI